MFANPRKILIFFFTFIPGLYFFLEYVLPKKLPEALGGFEFGLYHDQISTGIMTLGIMAIGLGLINILQVHGGAILRNRPGRFNSYALLLAMVLMFIVEGNDFLNSEKMVASWQRVATLEKFVAQIHKDQKENATPGLPRVRLIGPELEKLKQDGLERRNLLNLDIEAEEGKTIVDDFVVAIETALEKSTALTAAYSNPADFESESFSAAETDLVTALKVAAEKTRDLAMYNYENSTMKAFSGLLNNGLFFPLGSAMFSLLAFYIASAAYRTFRIRSVEAFVMMLAAMVVMLGQIPHGPLYISKELPAIRFWLLDNLSTPAFRAIFLGSGVAMLAMAVRMWLSLERSPLAVEDDAAGVANE